MLKKGIIDGSTRFYVDDRKLNNLILKDSYPLPRIDESLEALRGSKWYSTIDLQSGYFQVEMDPVDAERKHSQQFVGYFSLNLCVSVSVMLQQPLKE